MQQSPEPGKPPGERAQRRREWSRLADLSTLGLVFPVAVVLGYLAGRYVGSWLDAPRPGALVGVLVGVGAGFYNLIKVVRRLDRDDAEARAEARDGADDGLGG